MEHKNNRPVKKKRNKWILIMIVIESIILLGVVVGIFMSFYVKSASIKNISVQSDKLRESSSQNAIVQNEKSADKDSTVEVSTNNPSDIQLSENQTLYDNGDYVYIASEENLVVDEESCVLFFNNLLIVYLMEDISQEEAEALAESVGGELVGKMSGCINAMQIKTEETDLKTLQEKADQLMQNSIVLYASYEYPMEFDEQSINNKQDASDKNPWTDNGSGNPISDKNIVSDPPDGNDWWAEAIGAYTAWNRSVQNERVKVGILDNGFQLDHSDLKANIQMLGEYKNYYDYDEKGDFDSHGTHVAGLIGANNNNIGIRGVADGAELFCVDWSPNDKTSFLNNGQYIECTKKLIENNIKVINNSFGVYWLSKKKFSSIQINSEENDYLRMTELFINWITNSSNFTDAYESYKEHMKAFQKSSAASCIVMITEMLLNSDNSFLVIQAAGNGVDNSGPGVEAEKSCFYASIDQTIFDAIVNKDKRKILADKGITFENIMDHIIIVGAVDNIVNDKGNYKMCDFSNYGDNVTICAPGSNILSTVIKGKNKNSDYTEEYGMMNGTSMAAPIVSGSAALLWSIDPTLSSKEVKDLLTSSSEKAYREAEPDKLYPMLNIGESVCKLMYDFESPVHHCDTTNQLSNDYSDYSYVYFGSYPQSEVTDATIISEIDSALSGIGQIKGDVTVNDKKYRKIDISDSGETKYWSNATYRYFEWEPIKWKVLKKDGRKAYLMSANALDCKKYNDSKNNVAWDNCTLRSWLNGDTAVYSTDCFYKTAFSIEEQDAIVINNNTSNIAKILLPTLDEVKNSSFGFCEDETCFSSTRWAESTDYCHAMGAWIDTDVKYTGGNTNCWWWLRDMGSSSGSSMRVYGSGKIYTSGVDVDSSDVAVVPTLTLDLSSNTWIEILDEN